MLTDKTRKYNYYVGPAPSLGSSAHSSRPSSKENRPRVPSACKRPAAPGEDLEARNSVIREQQEKMYSAPNSARTWSRSWSQSSTRRAGSSPPSKVPPP